MISFEDILKPETVEIIETCESRKSILERASCLLSRNQKELDQRGLLEKFIEREELGSTALDDSEIAIPHCRHELCMTPTAALIRVNTAVPFGREEKVRLVVALVVPAEATSEHLQILRTIALIASSPSNLKQLLTVQSPTDLYTTFVRFAAEECTP
ncbi:MAG: PTS sugar transporter subunit IIA [Gammaproteobacteria bacterium]|nr:PTS sugar transporter subunit IIA [Gammaproteobacteria bacterium]